jgi:hypothetical protein
MNHQIPFQTDTRKSRFRLELINPNDPAATGPCAASREPARVRGGLLDGWNADYVKAMKRPQAPLEGWEQVAWNQQDQNFINTVTSCSTPEQVERCIPSKWLPHGSNGEIDDRLARVCDLCTALVNRYLAYEEGGATAPRTTAQWREHQRLKQIVADVIRVLEASVGESLTPAALRDPAFVRQCWQALCEDDQNTVETLLHDTDAAEL